MFSFFFSEKEKQETTSSDCFCLSILVFPLCCPQNSTERADIGRIIFLTLILLTSEALLSATHHRGWNIIPVLYSEGKINFKMNWSWLVSCVNATVGSLVIVHPQKMKRETFFNCVTLFHLNYSMKIVTGGEEGQKKDGVMYLFFLLKGE